MKGTSPVQRTMRVLREQGNICAVTEKWNAYGGARINGKPVGIRQDLFGIVDLLVLDPERGFIGIQCCGQSFSAHYKKLTIENAEMTTAWLKTPGGKIEIWSWRKIKMFRGAKAMHWQPRIREITMADFEKEK